MQIVIEKKAADGTAYEGVGFRIYDNTTQQYIDENGYCSKMTTVYTGSEGTIKTAIFSATAGKHDISVREVALKNRNDYYYVVDTTIYGRETLTVSDANTLDNPLVFSFSFTNRTLSLTISKVDYASCLSILGESLDESDLDTSTGQLLNTEAAGNATALERSVLHTRIRVNLGIGGRNHLCFIRNHAIPI